MPKFISTCKNEAKLRNCNFTHESPDEFVKSQWQTRTKSLWFLLYKAALAIIFTITVILSISSAVNRDGTFKYYLIYLTNLGILLCMVNALCGFALVATWYFQEQFRDKVNQNGEMPRAFKIFWGLHNTSLILSLLITIIYWSVIYNNEEHELDLVNILTHACNSIFMIIDIVLVAFPVRLQHFVWPIGAGMGYAAFSLIYYLAGGTDEKGNRYIYNVLDWEKPGTALITVCGTFVFGLVLHMLMFWIYRLRVFVYKRYVVNKVTITPAVAIETKEQRHGQLNSGFECSSQLAI